VTPARLSRTVLHAVRRAAADGALGSVRASTALPQRVTVESPPRRGPGDYAVNVAFRLAGAAGMTPYAVAQALRTRLLHDDGVEDVEIAGGGFLNVTLDARARAALVAELAQGAPEEPRDDRPAADIACWSAATGDDPAVLAVRTAANPLFRVQYAHARTRRLSDNARELGIPADPYGESYDDPGAALLALLADHRRVSEQGDAARHARHLVAVADAFFDFHDQCPPLPRGDEKPAAAHRARFALVEAAGTVLAGGLTLLGVSAPAHL
jgi:arginyl-tRNA synthetase